MAGPTLSRFLGLFRLRDASNPSRQASVSAAGEVAVADTRLGEVQASPTQYTVLDRLKVLASALAGTLSVRFSGAPNLDVSATATLAIGSTPVSGALDCRTMRACMVTAPSNLLTSGVTIISALASDDNGADAFVRVNNQDGSEWSLAIGPSSKTQLPYRVFGTLNYVKFRAGTAASPQAVATADTVLKIARTPS